MVTLITHILLLLKTRSKDSIQRLWKKAFVPVRRLLRNGISVVMQKVTMMVERLHLVDARLKSVFTFALLTACGVLYKNKRRIGEILSSTRQLIVQVISTIQIPNMM